MRYALKSEKSDDIGTDCFVPSMKAANGAGMVTSEPMADSTVSLNLAG